MKYEIYHKKKQALDSYRPLPEAMVSNLENWFRIELTYTSNAIEGNTLTRQETALVVEKGLTVGGKSLKEHLEAANHADAINWIASLTTKSIKQISEKDILHLHSLILKGIDDTYAGHYRNVPVRIAGSAVVLPNYLKISDLMEKFISWLHNTSIDPIELAALAHYELVTIHPFVDGNGRTARLLMNLILMIYGFPPAIIKPSERLAYINSLEKAQLGGSKEDYLKVIVKAVDRSLDIYLKALKNDSTSVESEALLKIGELAIETNETVATIRFWTKEGLLEVAHVTASGYQMYDKAMIARVASIKELKKKRLTLSEIKNKI